MQMAIIEAGKIIELIFIYCTINWLLWQAYITIELSVRQVEVVMVVGDFWWQNWINPWTVVLYNFPNNKVQPGV